MTAPVAEAVERGIAFLVSKQDPGGAWTDWALPPGPSSEWTTAYVGFRLGLLPVPFRARADRALARAADWLGRRALPEGWGYNPTVPPDADSTALATLCLAAVAGSPPLARRAALRRFQRADGGFATYPPDGLAGSWGRSHPEVTANASARFSPGGTRPTVRGSTARSRGCSRREGRTAPGTPSGGAPASSRPRRASRPSAPRARRPRSRRPCRAPPAPATASRPPSCSPRSPPRAVRPRSRASRPASSPCRTPTAAGRPPALRITRRDCDTPWAAPDAGPLFADPRRLFTTATVVAALGNGRATGQARSPPPSRTQPK